MMFSPFERLVALRYLRARRSEGFISVIAGFSLAGIALGVATLIIVMSVMNGFRDELLGRILGLNGHLDVRGAQGPLEDYDSLIDRLKRIPGVVGVMPVVDGQVMAVARSGAASGALVRGMRPEDVRAISVIANNIRAGSLDEFKGADNIMIGTRFANRFGVAPGDTLRLLSPQSTDTAFGSVPRQKTYTVVGLFEIGMYEYDNGYIFMPLEAAQLYFRTGNAVTDIEIRAADPDNLRTVTRAVLEAAGRPVRVIDWQQSNASFFNALIVERNVMFLILTLIIVVAAFNVISGLIMLVKGKGRDIAILRTMGATRGMVMRIFFLAGASVGTIGTVLGFVIGLLFTRNIETIRGWLERLAGVNVFSPEIYFLSRLPARIDYGEVATVVIMALALSLLATLYPSWRAARLDPVEALRYE
ncbi:MAG TPA: lipoprotein-releasing ABC transporter permease subunit [Alphaproteobacteria bacterium]